VLPSSTGIIGWRLPVAAITGEGIPLAAKNLQKNSILPAAIGITTTDRYPKVHPPPPPCLSLLRPCNRRSHTELFFVFVDVDVGRSGRIARKKAFSA